MNRNFSNPQVKKVFSEFPPAIRKKLMELRRLILKVAAETPGVGELEETLKWGQPSYVTSNTKSGSTIRIGREKQTDGHLGLFFHCQTTLVDTFKERYGDKFTYDKNRAIIFDKNEELPTRELSDCIAMALTYHSNKKIG